MMTKSQIQEAKKIWLDYVKREDELSRKDAESNQGLKEQLNEDDKFIGEESIMFDCPDFLVALSDNFDNIDTKLSFNDIDAIERKIEEKLFNDEAQLHKEKVDKYTNHYRFNLPTGAKIFVHCSACEYFKLVAKKDWDKFCEFVMDLEVNLD